VTAADCATSETINSTINVAVILMLQARTARWD
jgi:hypothetical protein